MYKLTEVLPSKTSGERLLLRLQDSEGKPLSVTISSSAYCKLGIKKGEISDELFKKMLSCSSYEQAVIKGMNILGYGINSEKKLKYKLKMKGFSEKNADLAVEYLRNHGYIDEEKDVLRLCESLICKKYGARRILCDIKSKGYGGDALAKAQEHLSYVDFTGLCADVVRVKFKKMPESPAEMKKALAKLVALGYNVSEVKNAMKIVMKEREE